jgi:hypothetical protein
LRFVRKRLGHFVLLSQCRFCLPRHLVYRETMRLI